MRVSVLKGSNSTTLKPELYITSHVPRNIRADRERNQFLITSAAQEASVRAFAMSVRQIKSSLSILITVTGVSCNALWLLFTVLGKGVSLSFLIMDRSVMMRIINRDEE